MAGDQISSCPPVPHAATAVGALSAIGELALIAQGGIRDDAGTLISMVLTAVVVVWVSHGVLAGRPVRLVLAALVLAATVLGFAGDVVVGSTPLWSSLHLLLAVAALGALVALVRSPFHRWQRQHHDTSQVPLSGVLMLASLAGLLGPVPALTAPYRADAPGLHGRVDLP